MEAMAYLNSMPRVDVEECRERADQLEREGHPWNRGLVLELREIADSYECEMQFGEWCS